MGAEKTCAVQVWELPASAPAGAEEADDADEEDDDEGDDEDVVDADYEVVDDDKK